jgi:hypothetical protein
MTPQICLKKVGKLFVSCFTFFNKSFVKISKYLIEDVAVNYGGSRLIRPLFDLKSFGNF